LHLWWARRPLAAARAVIFAQMVDDPSSQPDIFRTEKAQEKERQRLFKIIEDLVKWENTTNEAVLDRARAEIWQSWRSACADYVDHPRAKELFDRYRLPAFHDPFAGGGTLPLEAQRLGLESYASDLNPVAVLINKAMIEIPPKFACKPPVNPDTRSKRELIAHEWAGAEGIVEDVRYYGQWIREEAERRVGGLYPQHPAFPVTIYYAFKQSESNNEEGTSSTGWETFLDAVIRAGFATTGTWPIRTELSNRMVSSGTNALASSIILVCRRRPADAPTVTRRDLMAALKAELPQALKLLQRGNIAPVDLAQAAIGPGMAVYTRYSKVLDASGEPVSVRDALSLINQVLDEALAEQEGDFDADTRWAVAWFEQSGFDTGEYGVAETLSKAKNTSVAGMVDAGILSSKGGKVRLLRPDELPPDWDPGTDPRLTAWEVVHQLVRALESGGEVAAADLVAKLGSKAEAARELAYRLYTICERKKRAPQALSYNALVQSWPEIIRLAAESGKVRELQADLFG
jgi:adenine-specific DNA methylase